MKSNLLLEIQQIRKREKAMKIHLPVPSYLFVQNYGRSIEDDMDEIIQVLGAKEWFYFKVDKQEKERSILAKFLLEQKCRAKPGREYEGCILIELSGYEDEKETIEFLSYINTQRQRLNYIFTTKEAEQVDVLRRRLASEGFVRVVYGECYDAYEQMELFAGTLEDYQFAVEESARSELIEFFENKNWREKDFVRRKIQNMANELIYEKLLGDSGKNTVVTREELVQTISKMKEETLTKRQIGFV